MVKGGDELARGRIPEVSAMIRACRQDASAVSTEHRVLNGILMVKGGNGFGEAASQSLEVLSLLAVTIRAPSGLKAACKTSFEWLNETRSFPEAVSQSLAVLSELAVTIRTPSELNDASLTSS